MTFCTDENEIKIVIDRLHAMHKEIVADVSPIIKNAFRYQPIEPLASTQLPATYHAVGPQITPYRSQGVGLFNVTRQFYTIARLISATGPEPFIDDKGNEPMNLFEQVYQPLKFYYLEHPMLSTGTEGPLKGIIEAVSFQDSGFNIGKGAGGGNYGYIQFTHTVNMRIVYSDDSIRT